VRGPGRELACRTVVQSKMPNNLPLRRTSNMILRKRTILSATTRLLREPTDRVSTTKSATTILTLRDVSRVDRTGLRRRHSNAKTASGEWRPTDGGGSCATGYEIQTTLVCDFLLLLLLQRRLYNIDR